VEGALVAADRALELVPQYAPTLRARGLALMATGNYTAAEEPLTLAAKSVGEPGYLWPLWECLTLLGRREAARVLKEKLDATGSKRDPRTYSLFLATMGEQTATAVSLARQEVSSRKDACTLDALAWALQSSNFSDVAIW
jgi:hypothetical protein